MSSTSERWRESAPEYGLANRLRLWDFPCTPREAIDGAAHRNSAISAWARRGLNEGWLLRNAPTEMAARGTSLDEIAYWCIGGTRGRTSALEQTLSRLLTANNDSEETA